MNPQINNLLAQSIQYFESGNLDSAEEILNKILAMHAKNFDALHILGVIKGIRNHQQEAIKLFKKAISIDANHNFVQFNLAKALSEVGKDEEALAHHKKAVQLAPQHIEAWLNYGVSLSRLRRDDDALACFESALRTHPEYADAWSNYGASLSKLGRHDDALAAHEKALHIAPGHAAFWVNSAATWFALECYAQAVEAYENAVRIEPNLIQAWMSLGNTLKKLGRYTDALSAYNRVHALTPTNVEVWFESAMCFDALRWYAAALDALAKVIELDPAHAAGWHYTGTVQKKLWRFEAAQAALEKAISLRPLEAATWIELGYNFMEQKRHREALPMFARAMELDPEFDYVQGHWLNCKLAQCDWDNFEQATTGMRTLMDQGKPAIEAFSGLLLIDDPALEKKYAQAFNQYLFPDQRAAQPWPPVEPAARIKIGYYSADLYNHATAQLMVELFEKHDRSRFEIIAFSYSTASQDAMRTRLVAAMDQFIDVQDKTDQEIVDLSRSMGIDIAVDLKGYTKDRRMNIFALGAAPIQVSYLGYPGTLGADYMDYIVADATLVPPDMEQHYVEKIVRMPHSYQVNDRSRKIADKQFSRAELGLPEQGFVFACFNANMKYAPDSFAIWMRLLQQVPGSVLWMYQTSAEVVDHLRREAQRHGVDGARLVFAGFMELSSHLARHRQADLFLDTFNYNAHTTASDALWAGVPVVTLMGKTFSSRVAASLLNATGLPQLITHSPEEYEALARSLASDRALLDRYKRQLEERRLSCPLFDSGLFTRHLEAAYQSMQERRRTGLAPDHINVAA